MAQEGSWARKAIENLARDTAIQNTIMDTGMAFAGYRIGSKFYEPDEVELVYKPAIKLRRQDPQLPFPETNFRPTRPYPYGTNAAHD